MHVIQTRNVNGLFPLGVDHLAHHGVRDTSRAGDVIVAPTPVMSIYERPQERVLFSPKRDANPFFHLFESMWMLAGRDDAKSLDCYVRDFGERFAEPDGKIHGAYGRRWRKSLSGRDQLDIVTRKLIDNPRDRQCVIQMWDVSCGDLTATVKDRPCNTHVYLRVREVSRAKQAVYLDQGDYGDIVKHVLDLTVCCRSNDIVMGAYGANAVQFSVLQEYLAGRIGVGIGRMYQFSNNYHGYVRDLDRIGDPVKLFEPDEGVVDPYEPSPQGGLVPLPMGTKWERWDYDLYEFMNWHDDLWMHDGTTHHKPRYVNDWFESVATPVALANFLRRRGRLDDAIKSADDIEAVDWHAACVEWLWRRKK